MKRGYSIIVKHDMIIWYIVEHIKKRHNPMLKYLVICVSLLLTLACHTQEDGLLQKFEEIKELGNYDPQLALTRLDSLSFNKETLSTYLGTSRMLLCGDGRRNVSG